MDNLSDLLSQKDLREPPETKIIKDYVLNKYEENVGVKIDNNKITILVKNSALAGSLRMDIPNIQIACGTSKRVVIYLGK